MTEQEKEEAFRAISEELRKKRARCCDYCGAWERESRDCWIYGTNHPSPARCEYYLGWETERRKAGNESGITG